MRTGLRLLLERLRPSRLLATHEVDGSPVDEREDPGSCLRPLGDEAGGRPPDGEESVLHGVFGEGGVADDAKRKPVGHSAEAVVELRERTVIPPREQGDEGFIREVGKVTVGSGAFAHGGSIQR